MSAVQGEASVVLAPRLARRPSSRELAIVIAGLAVVAVLAAAIVAVRDQRAPRHGTVSLYLDGVALDVSGALVAVPAGAGVTYLPGSRVIDPLAQDVAAADRAWLATGTIPAAGTPWEDMVTGALLDLRALTRKNGALIAAHSPSWRYVWPRDASFGAAALAATGHTSDAVRILGHLQSLQAADGSFEARYLPDGSGGVPDDRSPQSDGAGWVLWATGQVITNSPPERATSVARILRPMVDRSVAFIAAQTATRTGLPQTSSDYWEVRETRPTLGIAAPMLAGLESAVGIYRASGRLDDAAAVRERARHLRAAILAHFGPDGYPRHLGREKPDAATAFLLPPFQPAALGGAHEAWLASADRMLRPAGGLAPGAGWREDGISWTPQTALYALTAATVGDRAQAEQRLTWLDRHRTASGALPEKVLADGSPAAVAPLSWTCALVILAATAIDDLPDSADPGGSAVDRAAD